MNRLRVIVTLCVATCFAALMCLPAFAADQPLVEPVLLKAQAAPAEWVEIGLKAARPGVVITAATLRPRDAQQFVMPLNDKGLQGDKAGDGVWSVRFPVPDSVAPGFYWIDFEASVTVDGQPQTAKASVQVEVLKGTGRSVQIAAPKEEAALSGAVDVEVKLATMVPMEKVVAYLGAASAELRRDGETWKGTIDTTRAANGRQELIVVASAAGTSADTDRQNAGPLAIVSALNSHTRIPVFVRNPYNFYWGDLHAHTIYSDGVQTPVDAYRHARDVAKLDFFCVTDHDDALTFDEYADCRSQADAFDKPGSFAALYGVEWTTEAGHMCFYMADRFRLSPDLAEAYRELNELGVLAHFNHPGATDFQSAAFFPEGMAPLCAAEARNEKEEASWVAMLNAGWRVAPDGSEDKHDPTWGDGANWTVALARDLSRAAILDAMRARRVYSTFDRNMRLDFTLDGEDMGAVVSRNAGNLPCVVDVSDPDAAERIARIDLILDGRPLASAQPNEARYRWTPQVPLTAGPHYVYIRVTEADGNQAWSSPVWVTAH
jgi:hypothetical protein